MTSECLVLHRYANEYNVTVFMIAPVSSVEEEELQAVKMKEFVDAEVTRNSGLVVKTGEGA